MYYDRYMTTRQFLEQVAIRVGDPFTAVQALYKKTKYEYEWGFKYKCIETGVNIYKKAKRMVEYREKIEKEKQNNLNNIISLYKQIGTDNITYKKSSGSNYFIAELFFNGRCYKSIGKTKKRASFNVRKYCAIIEIKGDWVSNDYVESLSGLITEKLSRSKEYACA